MDIAREVFSTQDVAEGPMVGVEHIANTEVANDKATEALNAPEDSTGSTGDSAEKASTTGEPREAAAAAVAAVASPESATDLPNEVQTGHEADYDAKAGTQAKDTIASASGVDEDEAKSTGGPKATLPRVSASEVPDVKDRMMSEYEHVQIGIMNINQERIRGVKNNTDLRKQKSTLLAQISQHQDEIATLKTRLSPQNVQHQAETEKQKDAEKDVSVHEATMKLGNQDLEAKIGRLMQKNDELVQAASTASEETNTVKARVRGQQNRVAELREQIAIIKQVEDGRKKQLEESRHQNEALRRQNMGLQATIVNWETEITSLRRDMATISAENTQLRAAVVERVLSTPVPQGTPQASGSPAAKVEDCEE